MGSIQLLLLALPLIICVHGTPSAETLQPSNCADVALQSDTVVPSGVYTVYLGPASIPCNVYCDMDTEGGGWTVIQRRGDGAVGFDRSWMDYVNGFGNLTDEFWLGNGAIAAMTAPGNRGNGAAVMLRVELKEHSTSTGRWAEYGDFSVAGPEDMFRLSLGDYSGTAGDSMRNDDGEQFSTPDRDNSQVGGSTPAAEKLGAGWWFHGLGYDNVNINGFVRYWKDYRGYHYSFSRTEMKIRPKDFINPKIWTFTE